MSNPIYDDVADAPEASTLEEVRAHQARLREVVAFAEKAKRLAENPDFKDLVMDYYLIKEPARLVGFLAADNIPAEQRDVVAADLRSIGHFKNTFSQIVMAGVSAANDLTEVDSAIAEYIEENGDN